MSKSKKTPVPPFLIPLIEVARLIPLNMNMELPLVEDESLKFELNTYDDISRSNLETMELRRILEESLGRWSEDLKNSYPKKMQSLIKKDLKNILEYIWGEDSIPEWEPWEEITYLGADRLSLVVQTERAATNFIDFRFLLNQIKILISATNKISNTDDVLSAKDEWEIEQILNQIPIQAKRKYNPGDGTVLTSVDEFTRALNNGVDIRRIRECKWCHKVFWAGRKDQNCCDSPEIGKKSPCANSYNNFNTEKNKKYDLLKRIYKGKAALAYGVKITYNQVKQNQSANSKTPETKVLNSAVKIKDILMDNSELKTIYKFEIFDTISKKDGFIEFKYKNNLENHIAQLFSIK